MNASKEKIESNDLNSTKYSSGTKFSYGLGQMIKQFIEVAFVVRIFYFYENEVLLPILLVGLGYVVYGLWNMINDPLVGYLSDRSTRFTKKWGKRFPWIMIGVFANIIIFFFVFTPPDIDPVTNSWVIFIYFFIIICAFDGFFSLWTTNYFALFPVKFRSDQERRSVNGIKTILAQIGLFLAVLIPPLFIEYGDKQSYFIAAIVVAIISFVIAVLMIKGVREDEKLKLFSVHLESQQQHGNFFKNMKIALKHKNYLAHVISAALFNSFATVILASLPFLVRYILNMPADTELILQLGLLLTGLISVPIWTKIIKKFGNKRVNIIGFIFCMIIAFLLLFVQDLIFAIFLFILAGAGVGSLWVTGSLILSDVIDESAVINGKRQEGIYFGIENFFGRMEVVAQALVFMIIHIVTGFEPGAPTQEPLALWGLRVQYSLIPMFFMLVGCLVFWKLYTLTPNEIKSIQNKLKELNL